MMSSGIPLSPPWELRWSKTKSRFYYFNTETKRSQWKRPREVDQKSQDKKCSSEIKCSGKMSGKGRTKQNQDASRPPVNSRLPRRNASTVPEDSTTAPSPASRSTKPTNDSVRKDNSSVESAVAESASSSQTETQREPEQQTPVATSTPTPAVSRALLSCPQSTDLLSVLAQKLPAWYDASVSMAVGEEEQMEVEDNPEVQLIFQEIQGVRDEMLRLPTEEVAEEVQMIVDSLVSVSPLLLPSTTSKKMCLILDTNLFLEDWGKYLLQVKDWLQRQSPDFIFVIPWIVIQELDRIKDNKSSRKRNDYDYDKPYDLQARARHAVNRIHEWLVSRDPSVTGQNPREAAANNELKDGFMIENNDDKILHCCLQYQEKYSVDQVALLTLDKNLRNKAMVLGIHTFSRESLNNWIMNVFPTYTPIHVGGDNRRSSSASTYNSQRSNYAAQNAMHQNSRSDQVMRDNSPVSAADLIGHLTAFASSPGRPSSIRSEKPSPVKGNAGEWNLSAPVDLGRAEDRNASAMTKSLETVMLDGLSSVLELSMREAYKDFWERTLNMEKPWSLTSVVKAIEKFWLPIFKSFWHRNDLDLMKDLASSITECPASSLELLDLIAKCKHVWTSFFSPKWSHKTVYTTTYKEIRKEVLSKLKNLENSVKSTLDGNTSMDSPKRAVSIKSRNPNNSSDISSTSCPSPSAMMTSESSAFTYSEDELQNVYVCFDNVLRQVISMRDLLMGQLSLPASKSDRQCVVESFMSLHQYINTLHELYQKAMSPSESSDDSGIYADLASALMSFMSFRLQSSVVVSPITWQAMKAFFCDSTRTEIVHIGLAQIETIVASILDGCRLISPTEVNARCPT